MSINNYAASNVKKITPSDSVDLPQEIKAILADADGTLKITNSDGSLEVIPIFKGYNPIRPKRVWATGGSFAGNLFGCSD